MVISKSQTTSIWPGTWRQTYLHITTVVDLYVFGSNTLQQLTGSTKFLTKLQVNQVKQVLTGFMLEIA